MRKKETEEIIKKLVEKLKLDKNTVGLLVYSKGSVMDAEYADRVMAAVDLR